MSYFEIFFYCLSFVLACGFIVHAAATVIISNLEDESVDLFPDQFVVYPKRKTANSAAQVKKRRSSTYRLTSAQ